MNDALREQKDNQHQIRIALLELSVRSECVDLKMICHYEQPKSALISAIRGSLCVRIFDCSQLSTLQLAGRKQGAPSCAHQNDGLNSLVVAKSYFAVL